MLVERTLFGTVDKVQTAIELLRFYEPPDGYELGFSGGKDSTVIDKLAQLAGVNYTGKYNLTTVDPPELVQNIKKSYPHIIIDRPEKTMWQLIVENGMPPLRQQRYCCRVLKERSGTGKLVTTGVRKQESHQRSKRQQVEACYNDNSKRFIHPILDWTEREVWEFIHKYDLPYCKLYDEGWKRLG